MNRLGAVRAPLRLATWVLLCSSAAAGYGSAAPLGSLESQGKVEFKAHCASCHGGALEGGQHAPPLLGAGFNTNWAGKRARSLYSRIISTMPQNDPGSLTEPQALSITLYVFAMNGISLPAAAPINTANDLNALNIPTPVKQESAP